MTRDDLIEIIEESRIFQHWHWFSWHFNHTLKGVPNLLADSIVDACLVCENCIPGYAKRTISIISSIGGREKHLPDWEQLLQVLAELLVVSHVLGRKWEDSTTFESEPSVEKRGKNPEILVQNERITLAVEVKAPALFSHQEDRAANPEQVAARFGSQDQIKQLLANPEKVTLPRDNPIKDFLISSESKFEQFQVKKNFVGVLVIVWDDFIYEPLSSLLHPGSGLLTENSFCKDADGKPIVFPSVGAVVLIRQLHQIVRACRDEQLADGLVNPLQYSIPHGFPPKVLVANGVANQDLRQLEEIFEALAPDHKMGAEYTPKELVWWM
ncbi:hypothetical protein [Thioalkalivibrio versutus]|uniref:hypothetical protein n=1 Tax=Thioalkalivibrio versutus TaxID=106634 RepID=UPI000AFC9D78|nr:hypothetical protein [Thioalkalivibrio versutus]